MRKCGRPLGPGRPHRPDPVQTPARAGGAERERREDRTRLRLNPGLLYLVLVPLWLILAVAGAVATEEPTAGEPGNQQGRVMGGVIATLLIALLIRWGWLRLIKKSHKPVMSPLVFVVAIAIVLPSGLPHVGSLVSGDLEWGQGDPSTARNSSAEGVHRDLRGDRLDDPESFFRGVEGYEFIDAPQGLEDAQRASMMEFDADWHSDFTTKLVVSEGGKVTGTVVTVFIVDPETVTGPDSQKDFMDGMAETPGLGRPEALTIGGEEGHLFSALQSYIVVVWLETNVPTMVIGDALEDVRPVAEALLEAR